MFEPPRDRIYNPSEISHFSGAILETLVRVEEIKIRAERKAGEMLAETTVKGGERHKSHDGTYERKPVLSDIGITKSDSSRWQSIASIPEEQFEKHVEETKKAKQELASAGTLRLAKMIYRQIGQKERN